MRGNETPPDAGGARGVPGQGVSASQYTACEGVTQPRRAARSPTRASDRPSERVALRRVGEDRLGPLAGSPDEVAREIEQAEAAAHLSAAEAEVLFTLAAEVGHGRSPASYARALARLRAVADRRHVDLLSRLSPFARADLLTGQAA